MDAGLILLEGVAFLSLFRVCVPELVEGRRVLWCCRFRRGLRRFRRLGRRFFGCGSLSPVDFKLLFLAVRGTVRVTVLRRIRFFLVLGRRFAVPPTLALAGSVALSGILGLLPLGLPSLPVVDADSVRRPVQPLSKSASTIFFGSSTQPAPTPYRYRSMSSFSAYSMSPSLSAFVSPQNHKKFRMPVASNFEQPSCLYRFRSFGPSILSCTLIHAIFSPACLYDGYAVGSHHSLPGKSGWSLAGTVSLASCGASGSGFFS